MVKNPLVSIAVTCYNDAHFINACLDSLLGQSFKDFELIVVDDCSTDNSFEVIKKFAVRDKRIRAFRNERNLGVSGNRNICLSKARGEYLFFTDSDCVASKNWVAEGLKTFRGTGCAAVEGSIVYVSEDFKPSYSDRVVRNSFGGHYMTASMAYRVGVALKAGGFSSKVPFLEDRDFALRVMKHGRIIFNKNMSVVHQRIIWNAKSFFVRYSNDIVVRCVFNREHGLKVSKRYPFVQLSELFLIFFPFILFMDLFRYKFSSPYDFLLLLIRYPRAFYLRFLVWKTAFREKLFMI